MPKAHEVRNEVRMSARSEAKLEGHGSAGGPGRVRRTWAPAGRAVGERGRARHAALGPPVRAELKERGSGPGGPRSRWGERRARSVRASLSWARENSYPIMARIVVAIGVVFCRRTETRGR
jgi:hypothetical protein